MNTVKRLLLHRTFRIFLALVVLVLVSVLIAPTALKGGHNLFLTWSNLGSILSQVTVNGILAVGMTLVILLGAIDLSVGMVMALGSITAAMLLMERSVSRALIWSSSTTAVLLALCAGLILNTILGPRLSKKTRLSVSIFVAALLGTSVILWARSSSASGIGLVGVLFLVMGLGGTMGFTNGLLTAYGRIQAFIVTLGTMSVAYGLARLVSPAKRRNISYGEYEADPAFEILNSKLLDVIPYSAILFIGLALLGAWVLRYTVFGRHVFAVGGNEEAARLAGIPVQRIKILVFSVAGALAGVAGAIFAAQNEQGIADGGVAKELDAIAAVVIGGTLLSGGVGSILGTIVGVFIIGVLNTTLTMHNVDPDIQRLLKGAIIVAAALMQEGPGGSFLKRLLSRRRSAG